MHIQVMFSNLFEITILAQRKIRNVAFFSLFKILEKQTRWQVLKNVFFFFTLHTSAIFPAQISYFHTSGGPFKFYLDIIFFITWLDFAGFNQFIFLLSWHLFLIFGAVGMVVMFTYCLTENNFLKINANQ